MVNNSMKIKALLGIMTNREIPKFEQSLFDKLKSWDTDNAIWVGIVFSDWWILQDETRVELKENEVLVSRTTFERVQQLAKEHNLTVSDAFKLWLTLIGYPITTKHSFMTVKIVAVDDIVIGDFVCAHPLIGEFMPELDWSLGYPYALALMAASAIVPMWYFRKRGWLK